MMSARLNAKCFPRARASDAFAAKAITSFGHPHAAPKHTGSVAMRQVVQRRFLYNFT